MSILTREDILDYIKAERIAFKPTLDTFQLQTHAVDLRLGYTFLVARTWHITKAGRTALHNDYYGPQQIQAFHVIELERGQFFDLLPNEQVFVSSLETVTVPDDLMAVMYPRSSTNRKGISVDLTGIIDSGYQGQLTIPVRNNTTAQTVRLYPGERFCQIVFERLDRSVIPRKSRYHQHDIVDGVDIDGLPGERDIENKLIASGDIAQLKAKHQIAL
jgi:dCTP deaminase